MKLLTTCFLLTIVFRPYAQDLATTRKSFHDALLDPTKAEVYYEYVSAIPGKEPTMTAYKAIAEVLMAKEHWNPVSKLSHVKRYSTLMKAAIEGDANNLEIRFLRFAVEYQLPKILMMSHHLMEDRDFIVAHMDDVHDLAIDPGFVHYISWFMNHTGLLEPAQLTSMEASLSTLGEEDR